MGTTTAQLVAALGDRWRAAVDHPFIAACCSGSIQQQHLNTWLTQDYLFVRGFVAFIGSVLGSAPDTHVDVLLAGTAALRDELAWFRDKATQRGLQLATTGMQPACQAYRGLLAELKRAPYATQAAALWAIEACYHHAWASVLAAGQSEELREFAHRWGNAEFGAYVQQLAGIADEALAQSPGQSDAAAAVVAKVADLEVDFWSMAFYDVAESGNGQQQQQQQQQGV